jgi:transcriptional regulator with XRE-family HTH domain
MIATNHPLRRWRKDRDVTLAALAGKVGVTPSHLSEIERGSNTPSLELAAKLSQATTDEAGHVVVPIEQIADAAREAAE